MTIKKLLLIDLDGVLNNYDGNFDSQHIPKVKDGAKEFLCQLSQKYRIKIFTTRNALLTSKWLQTNNLDEYVEDVTNIKEPAYLYIDDRAISFHGNYTETLEDIDTFSVWFKE